MAEKTQRVPYSSSRNLADVSTSSLHFSFPVLENGLINHNHGEGYFSPCLKMSGLRVNFGSGNLHVSVETNQLVQLFCSELVSPSLEIIFNSLLAVKLELGPFIECLQLLLPSLLLVNGFDNLVPLLECFGSKPLHDGIGFYKVNLVA